MHLRTNVIDYFLEHHVKVKAAMHDPESPAEKMQQSQQVVVKSAAHPANSSSTT